MWFIFSIVILCVISIPLQESDKHKIIVALSERKPFTILNEIGPPNGLDVLIMQNFAQKFKFQVEYIVINSSLNYIFSSAEHFQTFAAQTNLR